MKKYLVSLFVVTAVVIFLPSQTYAQGTYSCRRNLTNLPVTCEVSPGASTCAFGYKPGTECSTLATSGSPSSPCETTSPACIADPNFGGVGERCREGDTCDAGLTCAWGTCHSFGGGAGVSPGPTPDTEAVRCGTAGTPGINTAIGCIPYDPGELGKFLLRWTTGISGGVSILLAIYASITIMFSGPDPRKLQGGKELLTASIAGLALVIFSAFVLRILGVDILGLFS